MDGSCLIQWTFANEWLRRSKSRGCRVTRRRLASILAISTAIDWVNRYRRTGSVAPDQIGGYRPKKLIGEIGTGCYSAAGRQEFTLRGLVGELAERGLSVDYRVVWDFVHDEKLSSKKDTDRQRARSCRRGAATPAMEGLSGSDRSHSPRLHR